MWVLYDGRTNRRCKIIWKNDGAANPPHAGCSYMKEIDKVYQPYDMLELVPDDELEELPTSYVKIPT